MIAQPKTDPKPIYELRLNQCRFAVSPDDAREFLFCAEPVEYDGCPYCAPHAALCFDRRASELRRAHAERAAMARAGVKERKHPIFQRPANHPKF